MIHVLECRIKEEMLQHWLSKRCRLIARSLIERDFPPLGSGEVCFSHIEQLEEEWDGKIQSNKGLNSEKRSSIKDERQLAGIEK